METTFAERLRWARYKGPVARRENKVVGATTLARATGCAQSLISGLERGNSAGSRHSNKFADALGVDRGWLATGDSNPPEGWDPVEAKKLIRADGDELLSVVHSAPGAHGRNRAPKWAREREAAPPVMSSANSDQGFDVAAVPRPVAAAATLQRSLMNDFMEFVDLVGPKRAKAFLELLRKYAELPEATARLDQS